MARLKPRTGAKRRAASDQESEGSESASQDIDSQQSPEKQQDQDVHLSQLDAAVVDSHPAVQDNDYDEGQQELHSPLPRARSRKRKPTTAAASEPEAAPAADHSSKRTRRGGAVSKGLYSEIDDAEFNYDWASSESEEQVSEDVDEDDGHEHFCTTCGGKDDEERLLLCEHCPRIYHLYCLDPPLTKVPKGDWLCPRCQAADDLLHDQTGLDKVLAVRVVTEGSGDKQQQQQEFYVKWKDRSYIHCSWVPEAVMTAAAAWKVIGQANPVAARLRKFYQQQSAAVETREYEEAEETGQLVNGINPAWLQVDKVLAVRQSRGGDVVEYLVSWKELPLEQATWEDEQDLTEFADELAAFRSAQTPIAAEAAARKRAQAAAADTQQQAELSAAGDVGTYDSSGVEHMRGAGTRKFEATPDFVQGGSLHPYQLEGLNWLYHKAQSRHNAILADEMGLGKTIQATAFMGALWKDCVPLPHLVVVPLTTINNWERELSIWAPYLRVVSLKGNAAARQLLLDHCMYAPAEGHGRGRSAYQDRVKFHVLLTTYEMVSKHLAQLQRLDLAALIVDEAHRLKNATSRLFQDLVRVNARHRLLLTGTPLQNNLDELFFLMNFLEPKKFPSVDVFRETYAALDDKDKVGELHRQLKPHLLRRLKKDVLKQLPPKMEQMVRVELSDEQRELYKAILSKNYEALVDKSKGVVKLRNVMMELRKTVNHPCLLGYDIDTPAYNAAVARRTAAAQAAADAAARAAGVDPSAPVASETTEQLVAASGKLSLLDKMMFKLKAGGHRVLIYSQFTRTLDVLEDWVVGRGWGYERIDGDVSGTDRQKRVDSFNSQPERKFVFLLSTRAGGLGINLATADTVIIYDSDWNPHNDLQALARAHRLGQTSSVMVFRLVTRGTIEERMLQRAKSKMVLEHLVVAKAAKSDKLAQEELDDILRYGAKELFADDEEQEQQETQTTTAAGASADGTEAAGDADQPQQQHQKRMKIVYDDAAIDRLLDRSQVAAAAAAAAKEEGEDDEFTKAFKVADFDMVEQQDDPAAAEQQQADTTAQPQTDATGDDGVVYDTAATELHKSQQQFWAAILGERPVDQKGKLGLATEELGQRRARQAARYIFYDSETDTDSGAQDDEEEEGEQQQVVAAGDGDGDVDGTGRQQRKRRRITADDDDLYQVNEHESESEEIHDDADGESNLVAENTTIALHQSAAAATGAGAGAAPVKPTGPLGIAVTAPHATVQPPTTAAPPPVSVRQTADGYPLRATGVGALLQICGLGSTERHAFMSVLMHYGPPFIHSKPELGWQPYEQHLRNKTKKELESYLLVFLEHLQDVAIDPDSSHGSKDFLPHSLIFVSPKGQVHPNKIWERISTLQLLAEKIWSHGNKPADSFVCGGQINNGSSTAAGTGGATPPAGISPSSKKTVDILYKNLSGREGGWGPAQDYSLVRGVFIAGYDSWSKIIALPALNIKEPLRVELGIPTDYDTPTAVAAVTAAAGSEPLPDGVTREQYVTHMVMQQHKQAGTYRRKELEWLDKRVKAIVNALRVEMAADAQLRQKKQKQAQPSGAAHTPQQQQKQQRLQPQSSEAARNVPQQKQQAKQLQRKGSVGQIHSPSQMTQQAAMRVQQQGAAGNRQQQQSSKVSRAVAPSPQWQVDVDRLYQLMRHQLSTIKAQASQAVKNEQPDGQGIRSAAEQFRDNVQQLQQHAHQLEMVMSTLLPQQTASAAAAAPPELRRGGAGLMLPAGAPQQQPAMHTAASLDAQHWRQVDPSQQQPQNSVSSAMAPSSIAAAAHVPLVQQSSTLQQPGAGVMPQSAAVPVSGGQQHPSSQQSGQSVIPQAVVPQQVAPVMAAASAAAAVTNDDVIVLD